MNQKSPFEQWRENHLYQIAVSPEILKLIAEAFQGGRLYEMQPFQKREWVGLTDEELRIAFGKLYPSDIGILELAENNKDYAVEAIGARHHWTAFKAGARASEAKLKQKNGYAEEKNT